MARRYVLECWNGQVWEFNNPACPLSLRTDPTGLEGAAFQFDDQKNVGQAGVTMRDRMDDPNFVGLDVKIGPVTPGVGAVELLRKWRHSLGRGKQIGRFHTITDFGGDRFQDIRLGSALAPPNLTLMQDAGVILSEPVVLRSDESWWRRRPVERTFAPAQFATATVETDSDEPVWPHIVITGPITLPTIGWMGEAVPLPTIAAGDRWTIETDPDWFQINDSTGADRSWIGRRWYKQIPAGRRTVPITITGTGTSSATKVEITVPQLHWAAL